MKKIILILIISAAVIWVVTNREQADGYAKTAKDWFDVTVLKKESSLPVVKAADVPDVGNSPTEVVKVEPIEAKPIEEPVVGAPISSTTTQTLPADFYYTKERVSKVTDSGVAAIAKGVKVKKLAEQGGDYLVTDGTVQLTVSPSRLTRDDSEISALSASIALPKVEEKKDSVAGPSNPSNSGPHPEIPGLTNKLQAYDIRLRQVRKELGDLQVEQEIAKVRGRAGSTHVQIAKVQGQLNQLAAERQRIADRLAEIQ